MTIDLERVALDVTVGTLALCIEDLRASASTSRHADQLRLWAEHLAEDLKTLRLLAQSDDPDEPA